MTDSAFNDLARQLLGATGEQLDLLERGRQKGLIEIAPVSLPQQPLGDNNHLGWPVATRAGDTMVLVRRRIPATTPLVPVTAMSTPVFRWSCGRKTAARPGRRHLICAMPWSRRTAAVAPL